MPYRYPLLFGIYLFNKYLLHTYVGLEDTEVKRMTIALKKMQPAAINS